MSPASKKKTLFTQITLLFFGVFIIIHLIKMVININELKHAYYIPNRFIAREMFLIIDIMILSIYLIYSYKLFFVKKDIIKYTHFSFGGLIFLAMMLIVININYGDDLYRINMDNALTVIAIVISNLIFIITLSIMWAVSIQDLKNAQKENLMEFS